MENEADRGHATGRRRPASAASGAQAQLQPANATIPTQHEKRHVQIKRQARRACTSPACSRPRIERRDRHEHRDSSTKQQRDRRSCSRKRPGATASPQRPAGQPVNHHAAPSFRPAPGSRTRSRPASPLRQLSARSPPATTIPTAAARPRRQHCRTSANVTPCGHRSFSSASETWATVARRDSCSARI